MASQKIKRWRIEPDYGIQTADGEVIPACSDDAIGAALSDGVAIVQRMGGSIVLQTARRPTDLRGEAVTTYATVEWLPHLNAEEGSESVVNIPGVPETLLEPLEPAGSPEPSLGDDEAEDMSSIPVEAR